MKRVPGKQITNRKYEFNCYNATMFGKYRDMEDDMESQENQVLKEQKCAEKLDETHLI